MTCPECGHELPESVNFCSNCGAPAKVQPGDTTSVIPIIVVDEELELSEAQWETLKSVPQGTGVLVVLRGPNQGSTLVLSQEVVTAGRHPQSDIFLDDVTVSRHHAKLVSRDGQTTITDQNSLNGTYVNRTLIEGETVLRRGDEVQIGKFRMLYLVDQVRQD